MTLEREEEILVFCIKIFYINHSNLIFIQRMHTSPGRPSQKGSGGGGGVAVPWARVLAVAVSRGRKARRRPMLPLLVPGGAASSDRDVTVER